MNGEKILRSLSARKGCNERTHERTIQDVGQCWTRRKAVRTAIKSDGMEDASNMAACAMLANSTTIGVSLKAWRNKARKNKILVLVNINKQKGNNKV